MKREPDGHKSERTRDPRVIGPLARGNVIIKSRRPCVGTSTNKIGRFNTSVILFDDEIL